MTLNRSTQIQLFFGLLTALFIAPFYLSTWNKLLPFLVIILGFIIFLYISYKFWIYLFVLSLPLYLRIPLGVDIPLPLVFLGSITFALVFEKLYLKKSTDTHINIAEVFLLFSVAIIIFSILRSWHIPLDWKSLYYKPYEKPFIRSIILALYLCLCFLSSLIISRTVHSQKQLKSILAVYTFSGCCVLILGAYAYVQALNFPIPKIPALYGLLSLANMHSEGLSLFRLQGFCQEPALAGRLFLCIFFSLIIFIKDKPKTVILFLILTIFCIIATFSRSAWFIMGITVAVFTFIKISFSPHRAKIFLRFTLLVTICITIASLVYSTNENFQNFLDTMVLNNFKSSNDYIVADLSASIRLSNLIMTKRIFAEYPFLGIGVGNLPFHSHLYFVYISYISEYFGITINAIGNSYAQYLIETGLIGLTFLLLFFASHLLLVLKTIVLAQSPEQRHIFTCLFCTIFANILHSLFFSFQFFNFWFFIGLSLFIVQDHSNTTQ